MLEIKNVTHSFGESDNKVMAVIAKRFMAIVYMGSPVRTASRHQVRSYVVFFFEFPHKQLTKGYVKI